MGMFASNERWISQSRKTEEQKPQARKQYDSRRNVFKQDSLHIGQYKTTETHPPLGWKPVLHSVNLVAEFGQPGQFLNAFWNRPKQITKQPMKRSITVHNDRNSIGTSWQNHSGHFKKGKRYMLKIIWHKDTQRNDGKKTSAYFRDLRQQKKTIKMVRSKSSKSRPEADSRTLRQRLHRPLTSIDNKSEIHYINSDFSGWQHSLKRTFPKVSIYPGLGQHNSVVHSFIIVTRGLSRRIREMHHH